MHKDKIDELALASGLEYKRLDDGSMGFRPYIYKFAQKIAAQVWREYEPHAAKDEQTIAALRAKVSEQASEILRLKTNASNAIDCLGDSNEQ